MARCAIAPNLCADINRQQSQRVLYRRSTILRNRMWIISVSHTNPYNDEKKTDSGCWDPGIECKEFHP